MSVYVHMCVYILYICLYTESWCWFVDWSLLIYLVVVIGLCLEHFGNQVVDWRLLINLVVVIMLGAFWKSSGWLETSFGYDGAFGNQVVDWRPLIYLEVIIRLGLEHFGNQVVDWRILINLVVVIRLCLEHFGNQVVDLRLLLIWWL